MKWCVVKTGFDMFDAFHAYGLSLLVASASRAPVTMRDNGIMYHLSSTKEFSHSTLREVLDDLLILPTAEDLLLPFSHRGKISIPVATLDGLFAVLFTTKDRILSVHDLLEKQKFAPGVLQRGLKKITKGRQNWKKYAQQEISHNSDDLIHLLHGYTYSSLAFPVPQLPRQQKDLTAFMTLDPALGYSTRQPISDGEVDKKINVTLHGARRCATLLAYLGASRFLRAQRVAGDQVNFYVPLASEITIHANTALTPLSSTNHTPKHALICQLLSLLQNQETFKESIEDAHTFPTKLCTKHHLKAAQWKGIAYQTLQTQGIQQSIPIDRGNLECSWIIDLNRLSGTAVARFWQSWLDPYSKTSVDEQEHLVDSLTNHQAEAWHRHLLDMTRKALTKEAHNMHLYSVEEVKVMTVTMTSTPLRTILEREEGTLRFGRALHQLGRFRPSILRDVIEDLEAVQTLDQLVRVLYHALHECNLAKAKYRFIAIPSNSDLAILITDVDQYGVKLLAGILMILSTLRFYQREIEKYETYSLIGVLLTLITQLPPIDDSVSLPLDEVAEVPDNISTFSLSEGESDA